LIGGPGRKRENDMGIFSRKKDVEPPAPPPPPPPTAKELARQYKREIDRAIREIDRERTKMEQQEKQIQINIKKSAKDGEMTSARMLAKELVRNREARSKMHKMKTQMQTASSQLTTMTTTQVRRFALAVIWQQALEGPWVIQGALVLTSSFLSCSCFSAV